MGMETTTAEIESKFGESVPYGCREQHLGFTDIRK